MGLYVRQLKLGPMDNFVYLLGAEDSPETAIVDPAWDVPAALRAAEEDARRTSSTSPPCRASRATTSPVASSPTPPRPPAAC